MRYTILFMREDSPYENEVERHLPMVPRVGDHVCIARQPKEDFDTFPFGTVGTKWLVVEVELDVASPAPCTDGGVNHMSRACVILRRAERQD